MLQPHTGSLLVDYYEAFLRDQDIEAFRRNVSARYNEGTLARLLQSGDTQARRASVLALGLFGGFGSNAAVARGLRDPDPTVRTLADNALWAIWFRADTPENNEALERVRRPSVNRGRFDEAIEQADRLIARAPGVRRGLQPAGHRPLLPGPVRRERRRLQARPGTQPLPHRGPGRDGPVPAPPRPPRRGHQDVPPGPQAPALQRVRSARPSPSSRATAEGIAGPEPGRPKTSRPGGPGPRRTPRLPPRGRDAQATGRGRRAGDPRRRVKLRSGDAGRPSSGPWRSRYRSGSRWSR